MFSKIFDVQNKRITTMTCDRCTFTEIYRTKSSTLGMSWISSRSKLAAFPAASIVLV
jgi:predicted nucleic-acid-binding Zn-ribbon protein